MSTRGRGDCYLFVAPVANLGHRKLPLETTPHSVIDTLWFSPCLLDTVVTIGLVAPVWDGKGLQKSHEGSTDLNGLVRFLTMGILTTMAIWREVSV
jgi:hypothetical protein